MGSPPIPRVLRTLAGLTYGIYLAHPLVAKVLATLFDVFSWPLVVHAVVVWALSALLVVALRRARLGWRECVDARAPIPGPALGERSVVR